MSVTARGRIVPPILSSPTGIVVDECPFCKKTHKHSLSSEDGAVTRPRAADCGQGEYVIDTRSAP